MGDPERTISIQRGTAKPPLIHPYRFQQVLCVRRLGGCAIGPLARDGGTPSPDEIAGYNRECRIETTYGGPDVTPSEVECGLALGVNRDNADRFERIRQGGAGAIDDCEALARIFEDNQIVGGDDGPGRLDVVLAATEKVFPGGVGRIPGLQTGVHFGDVGFAGDQLPGGAGFRDPWPKSRNQVGHFLTAVGLGFGPSIVNVEVPFLNQRMRTTVGAAPAMPDEEVAIRLMVGHEKKADPDGILAAASRFKEQFQACTDDDVRNFLAAEKALGTGATIDMTAAEPLLGRVAIDFTQSGNSIQDLRLSLAGWALGRRVRGGQFGNRNQIAAWIRRNLHA